MYFPQPGDLAPAPWEQKPPESGAGRVTPPWSNVNLPKQVESTIGQTAQYCRQQATHVPVPNGIAANGGKRSRKSETPYLEPLEGQTNLVYMAYLAHRVVTVLTRSQQVEKLVDAEREELLSSAGSGSMRRDPDAAEPRKYALTVLMSELTTSERRHSLLDCAAVLARSNEELADEESDRGEDDDAHDADDDDDGGSPEMPAAPP